MEAEAAPPKGIDRVDVFPIEYCALITEKGAQDFCKYVEKAYFKELLTSITRHIPGGWPVADVSSLFLHWISTYATSRYYETHHRFPHADLSKVVSRVLHLAEGWAELHIKASTGQERGEMAFLPPLSPESLHFADTTLYCDGVEYARWKKGINTSAEVKRWYAKKLGGPGWRVMVLSPVLLSCLKGETSCLNNYSFSPHYGTSAILLTLTLQQTYNRQGLVEHTTLPAPAGEKRSGERELLDDAKFFSEFMASERDVLFADAGLAGMATRHPQHRFFLPVNKSANVWKKASEEEKLRLKDLDAKHKRLALSRHEHYNGEIRRFRILSKTEKYRHPDEWFPKILKICVAFYNIHTREQLSRAEQDDQV